MLIVRQLIYDIQPSVDLPFYFIPILTSLKFDDCKHVALLE